MAHHGIKTIEVVDGVRKLTVVSTAIIGLVATAADAEVEKFPLDTPVLVTNMTAALAGAGTEGTLRKALMAISDQTNPIVIVVRVAPGVDDAATAAKVIGTVTPEGQRTGMQALLGAESLGMPRPRILGAPGLDDQLVTTAFITVANKLRGMLYARAIGATVTAANTYADGFSARELMLIWPETTGWSGDAVARALGLRARIDQEVGWHKTLSNMEVQGITGLAKPVFFDITGEAGDNKVLNDKNVTALVNFKGFRFWGNRTLSAEPLFAFESATRTAQVLRDTIADGLAWAIDKPLTAILVRDIIDTINNEFRSLTASGLIMGGRAWFDPEKNSQADLAGGKIVIDYDFTPCAPAESITNNQRITDSYYGNLAKQLAA